MLNKKSDLKNLEIDENWLRGIIKNVPNFVSSLEEGWPVPVPPTALTIKVVNLVRYSWYG